MHHAEMFLMVPLKSLLTLIPVKQQHTSISKLACNKVKVVVVSSFLHHVEPALSFGPKTTAQTQVLLGS